jgi:hypothetical protein
MAKGPRYPVIEVITDPARHFSILLSSGFFVPFVSVSWTSLFPYLSRSTAAVVFWGELGL